jgi:hypothetical protein
VQPAAKDFPIHTGKARLFYFVLFIFYLFVVFFAQLSLVECAHLHYLKWLSELLCFVELVRQWKAVAACVMRLKFQNYYWGKWRENNDHTPPHLPKHVCIPLYCGKCATTTMTTIRDAVKNRNKAILECRLAISSIKH